MASSSSDSNRDSNKMDQNNKHENIFEKFKHDVDDRITTVVQGIIGIPSILRNNSDGSDSKWAQVEADREERRREQLRQAESNATNSGASQALAAFREQASAHRYEQAADDKEYEIPVKTYRGLRADNDTAIQSWNGPDNRNDYDLFSVLSKDVIERLKVDSGGGATSYVNHNGTYNSTGEPDLMTGIRRRFYSSLRDILGDNTSILGDEKTLVPYLLYSPYSPLQLSNMPPLQRWDTPFRRNYTYREAFEDLLETTKNEARGIRGDPFDMNFPDSWMTGDLWSRLRMGENKLAKHRKNTPESAMEWMATTLVEKDILREESLMDTIETPIGIFATEKSSPTLAILMNFLEMSYAERALALRAPKTEAELYDHVFNTTIAARMSEEFEKEMKKAKRAFWAETEALRNQPPKDLYPRKSDEERLYEDYLQNCPEAKRSGEDKLYEEYLAKCPDAHADRSDRLPLSSSPTSSSDWSPISSDSKKDAVLVSKTPTLTPSEQDSAEGLISHETTTETETMPNGIVKKTVIVKKVYKSGETKLSIASNYEWPGHEEELEEREGMLRRVEHKDERKEKEGKKGGWFWK